MPVTVATVVTRIRDRLVETAAAFWSDTQLTQAFDDGAQQQHRRILANAKATGRLGETHHDYLKNFLSSATGNTAAGTQDIAVPATLFDSYVIRVSVNIDDQLRDAVYRPYDLDHYIRTTRDWGPTTFRPVWTVTPEPKVRLYVVGDKTVPNYVTPYRFDFYRTYTVALGATNSDLPDPFNEGPIAYAVARALQHERTDPGDILAELYRAADLIMPPPQTRQQGAA